MSNIGHPTEHAKKPAVDHHSRQDIDEGEAESELSTEIIWIGLQAEIR